MTLLEVIGVLAVIALLTAFLVPAVIRFIDGVIARKEVATLKTLAESFEKSIVSRHFIPAENGLPSFIATNAGFDLLAVTNNLRQKKRVFVLDKASGWLTANLPYAQYQQVNGLQTLPDQPRVMFVSSLGEPLPFSTLDADDFDALWNTPPGTVPNSGPWLGWDGRADEVKVHRLNLAPLFVRALLSTYQSSTNGHYALGRGNPTNAAPMLGTAGGYYLRGTELNLYTGMPFTNLNHSLVLNEDLSFVYEKGVWKSSVINAAEIGQADLSSIVAAFLSAQPNPRAWDNTANNQQVAVVTTMIDYMSSYNEWASQTPPFPGGNTWKNLLEAKRTDMMKAVQGLYSSAGQWTNYPPQITCP